MCVFGGPTYAISSWDQKSPQEDQSVCTPESLPPRKMTRPTDFLPQINRIRNKKGEVTTDTAEIQTIMRDYYKQLYANKMGNLEEMDKFLEMHNFLRLRQDEIENMNRPITSTEIETVI